MQHVSVAVQDLREHRLRGTLRRASPAAHGAGRQIVWPNAPKPQPSPPTPRRTATLVGSSDAAPEEGAALAVAPRAGHRSLRAYAWARRRSPGVPVRAPRRRGAARRGSVRTRRAERAPRVGVSSLRRTRSRASPGRGASGAPATGSPSWPRAPAPRCATRSSLLARYAPMLHASFEASVEEHASETRWVLRTPFRPRGLGRHVHELALAHTLAQCRTGSSVAVSATGSGSRTPGCRTSSRSIRPSVPASSPSAAPKAASPSIARCSTPR